MKKRILFVGKLGYHEKNISEPIIAGLSEYFEIDRLGENFDFFVPSNIPSIQDNYLSAIPRLESLKNYHAVFFVDYWNPIVPFFQFGRYYHNPNLKFIGLSHGSVTMENDVACEIQGSHEYEYYLNRIFDLLLVSRPFLKERIQTGLRNIKFCSYPMDHIICRKPEFKYAPRVVFAHRYHPDKGIDKFEKFATVAKQLIPGLQVIVAGKNEPSAINRIKKNGFKYAGFVDLTQPNELCNLGGYAWSSVYSELNGYAVWDLMSWGLTPLVNDHPAYYAFPEKYKYVALLDAIYKIQDRLVMTQEDWVHTKNTEVGNVNKIVNEIKALLHV